MSGPSEYFKKSVILLDENKVLFCSEDDRKSMKKYDAVLEYYLGSCWSHKKRKSSCCTIS
ncbi:hypothetical protein NERG_02594 [Nematocida ausubeli]|uniref:Uncharacterized protein n=1 Tax=Nematocida ausubeli (strain ATCC PRA-371 / ERTm2) TaxID=1913371 RepID=H8ZG73_NEMA1|nr:hypothetical protein NERG_02594 [Nematocida ausubeli]